MSEPLTLDLIWGADAIASFIGRTPRQTWEALNKGELPARQVNGRWCASRARLASFFDGADLGQQRLASPAPAPDAASPEVSKVTPRRVHKSGGATVHKLMPRKGRAA